MATVTKPIALDESFNTTEVTPRNIADVLAEGLSHITGRTASEVEYDNTESELTADNVQDALDEINGKIPTVPSVDIQTAVDEFETYNGGLLSECKVALSPNQDLHGYDSPWVGGANVNKFPSAVAESKTASGVTVVSDGHGTYTLSGTSTANVSIDFDIEQTYTIPQSIGNGGQGCCYFFNNKTLASDKFLFYFMDGTRDIDSWSIVELNKKNSAYSAMSGQTCNKVRFKITVGANVDGVTISPMFSEDGLTTNPFTWWKNICPISGHTQVDVDVSDGQTTQEQVTVNLGGTYYSGTLDVVSGELTVDSAFIASYNGETLPSTWISDRDVYAVGTTPTTGAEVCYKLATPQSIQLSPTMVKALVGENHLSAPLDGQEITESKYKQMFTFDDVIAYIQSLS